MYVTCMYCSTHVIFSATIPFLVDPTLPVHKVLVRLPECMATCDQKWACNPGRAFPGVHGAIVKPIRTIHETVQKDTREKWAFTFLRMAISKNVIEAARKSTFPNTWRNLA